MLFVDSTTGRFYRISAGSFPEITPEVATGIFTQTPTSNPAMAALISMIAAIPPTSPGPLVLPALTSIQSPQITSGPGSDIPTVVTPPAYANSTQIPNTAWVLANTAPLNPATNVFKIPLTFVASPGGAVVTYLTIQGGLTSGSSPITVPFSPSYLGTPIFTCTHYNTSGSGSSTVTSVGASNATITVGDGATGVVWCAIGVSN